MARNRRQSESMRFVIGRGCFLLFAGLLCVGFSVIKIIVGSEYVSKCPSREMIPVYIIVSGCLPILLSALRQPYDRGHEMEKGGWSMKVTLIIAVIGVMVNLAWLVAGTYLVISIWSGNICGTPPQIITGTTSILEPAINETFQSEYMHSNNHLINSNASLNRYIENKDRNKTTLSLNKTDMWNTESNKSANSSLIPTASQRSINTTTSIDRAKSDPNVKNVKSEPETAKPETTQISTRDNDSKSKENMNDVQSESKRDQNSMLYDVASKDNVLISKIGSEDMHAINDIIKVSLKTKKVSTLFKEDTDITKTGSQDKQCITCNKHILRFSLAVIIIDWLFVIFGMVFFCNFVYRRFSSIKSEILLINT